MGKPSLKKVLEASRVLLLAILGSVLALTYFSATQLSSSAFTFVVQLLPLKPGETVLFFPPVGQIVAATHYWPFELKITLLNVDPGLVQETMARYSGLTDLESVARVAAFRSELGRLLVIFILRCTAATFAGGAGAVFLLARRLDRRVLLGGAAAALLFLLLFAVTVAAPYDLDAFDNPRFTGALGAAPWVVNLVTDTIDSIRTVGERLELITANIHDLFGQLEQVHPSVAPSEIRVLHVSDIHNNFAAFDFIEKIVRTFDISLIIDTGDITDYGTTMEAELFSRISELPVPYLFVPGNHDSPAVLAAMREAGAHVLDSTVVEAAGLRVAGIADPSSRSNLMSVAQPQELVEAAMAFRGYLKTAGERPDIMAVHNPAMGVPFAGTVPIILSGHNHKPSVAFTPEAALINAGTTGASGLRGFQSPGSHPYSVVILYFNRDGEEKPHLTIADLIWIHQFQKNFTLQRYYRPVEPEQAEIVVETDGEQPEKPLNVMDPPSEP